VRLSNKIVGLDLAPFSKKVENHWCLTMKMSGDSTHPCWSPTSTMNGHDLTLPKWDADGWAGKQWLGGQ